MKNFSTEKIILGLVGGLTLLAVIFIVIFSANEQKSIKNQTLIASYQTSDKAKPKIEVSSTFNDLGKMKVKDEKSAEFTIKNTGSKPLILFKVSSSCDCTFGVVTIDGIKSQEFGMHSKSDWTTSLDPGKTATLSVIYRPFIMPVSGTITRDVFVQTNDPEKPKLTFTVKAFVE
ncbi:DUF1573 domain-containing protein [Candidatus Gottesmanbacteria bacterium]|nr:DUF1573 domain-containing protein [Candidatus Gottesmanbacteria bacterium]